MSPIQKPGVNKAKRARNPVGSNLKGFLVVRPLHATAASKGPRSPTERRFRLDPVQSVRPDKRQFRPDPVQSVRADTGQFRPDAV